jgi:outer membrane protein assembly factor BamA
VDLDTSQVSNDRNAGPIAVTVESGKRTTVRSLEITGNQVIGERTIRRIVRLEPGGIYRRSDMLESQRDLYLSGLFSEVDVVALPTQDSAKTVTLQLAEAPLRRLELRGGITTADFVQLESEWSRAHFIGGATSLTLRGTMSNLFARTLSGTGGFQNVTQGALAGERDRFLRPAWSVSAEYLHPFFFGRDNTLGFSVFTHRRIVPGVATDVGAGTTVAFTKDLGPRVTTSLGYTFEESRIEASDVYFCVSAGLCIATAIDAVSSRHALAPLSLVTLMDRSDDPFTPTRGVRGQLDLEFASPVTASDFAHVRGTLGASAYRQVSRHGVLAARVRLGLVRALPGAPAAAGNDSIAQRVIHPRKLFFAGGSKSVRGYGENQLGPRALTIDPNRLIDTTLSGACSAASLADGSCDPNVAGLGSDAFQPRPLGAASVLEGSVEYRFPLLRASGLDAAVFVDAGVLGTRRFAGLPRASAAITPGVGVRFDTPAGPVRLDIGVRPRVIEDLPVITQLADSAGRVRLVTLKTFRRYDGAEASGGALRQILSRLMVHLAIGPPF